MPLGARPAHEDRFQARFDGLRSGEDDMSASITRALAVPAWRPGRGAYEDRVCVEEPLEIRVNGIALAVTLRTPGEDRELALGFTLTEGVARSAADIGGVETIENVPP